MKKLIVTLALLLGSVTFASAQTKGFTFAAWPQYGGSLNFKHPFSSIDLAAAGGYAFNPTVFLRAQLEATVGLWPGAGYGENWGTYAMNAMLGPSVGVNLMKDKGRGIVDAVATVGHSLYVKDWNYICYDLGVSWAAPLKEPSVKALRAFMGIGFRYMDTHKTRTRDYLVYYAKFGFRFN